MKLFLYLGLILTALLFAAPHATAQLVNENFVITMPKGFKIGFDTKKNNMLMQEWVPQSESVEHWTEMITTQTFLGQANMDGTQFLSRIGQQWLAACPGSKPDVIHNGDSNGYPVSMLYMRCSNLPKANTPENTIFRAIKGRDSFYIVQVAFHFTPTEAQFNDAMRYLGTAIVCDSRASDHPCPKMTPLAPQGPPSELQRPQY